MKFRGWDKNQKKFIYNFAISANSGAPTIIHGNDELNNHINDFYTRKGDDMWGDYVVLDFTDWYAINDVEINKATEDKDKKGFYLFENDIVEYMGKIYIIKFEKNCFLLENDKDKIWWHELNPLDIESSMNIIGNIYEQRKTKLNVLKNL